MSGFDPVIHAPLRLRLCALLSPVEEAEFAMLRDRLEVADSVVSKHVSTLADAGYVKVTKSRSGGRATTWIALTRQGRRALEGHLAALREIIDASGG